MKTPSYTGSTQRHNRSILRTIPLATIGVIMTVAFDHAASAQASGSFRSSISSAQVDPREAFTFFFLMLGPIKILAPFVKMTEDTEDRFRRQLAVRATIFSSFALAAAALIGDKALQKYGVSLNVLALTGGLVLAAVALQAILEQFRPAPTDKVAVETLPLDSAVLRLAFPTIITPYGIAAVIIFTTIASNTSTKLIVVLLALGVLLLDLFVMLFARSLLRWLGAPLLILGSVLAIIQLAIGVQIIVTNLGALGMFALRSQ
jgi:multiple antibiotic resistance protein